MTTQLPTCHCGAIACFHIKDPYNKDFCYACTTQRCTMYHLDWNVLSIEEAIKQMEADDRATIRNGGTPEDMTWCYTGHPANDVRLEYTIMKVREMEQHTFRKAVTASALPNTYTRF